MSNDMADARHRREAIRTAAKVAFLKVRIEDKIRRGSVQRARVRLGELQNGSTVLFWQKDKNNKKGAWRGPGVVIGKQHENYWVSRGGRCYLCAPEHLRLASPEELGGLFTLKATKDDLNRLLEKDPDDEATFIGEEEPGEEDAVGADDVPDISELFGDDDEEMPLDLPNGDMAESSEQGLRRPLGEPHGTGENVSKRYRRKAPQEAHMLKRASTKRGREEQLEKEIPWSMIPESHRNMFREAEGVQWEEHLRLGALRPLSIAESQEILEQKSERIIPSRFAYRDKRRTNPEVAWKPKSRLVVGGHLDPDVRTGGLRTDSPTVSRTAVMCLLHLASSRIDEDWTAAAGDVTAAF